MTEYKHLTEKDTNDGKELNEVLKGLDDASKRAILIYASGIRDRQMIVENENKTA